jgi:hypothetical protein
VAEGQRLGVCWPDRQETILLARAPFLFAAISVVGSGLDAAALAGAPPAEVPHLLNCIVKDTIHLGSDGSLIKDPPLPPGARALGRISSFVVDVATAVVRLPGLGDIGWIPAKGDATSKELILTPVTALASATSISIHIERLSAQDIRFLFFETDRVMGGMCTFLP